MLFKGKRNSVVMYAKQTLHTFSFCNGSIKWWCQLIHYHRKAVALQVRQCGNIQFIICIHCANRQPHCNKKQLYRYVQACRMMITSSVSVLCLWTVTLQNVNCDNLPNILKCYQIYHQNCFTIINFGVADMTLQCPVCCVRGRSYSDHYFSGY